MMDIVNELSIHDTSELAAMDLRRDTAIICLRKQADSFTYHHIEAKKEAGKRLLHTIDKYGSKISKMNYQAETSVLDNLVADLQNAAEDIAAVKMLGAGDTVKEIKAANDLFNETYLSRVEESAKKNLATASDLVSDCHQKYGVLIKHIEANAVLNDSETYDVLIKQLNSLIEKFNILLAQRIGRGKNNEEEILK